MHFRLYYALWALIAVIYICNLTIDVMEVDAAQYASIALEMKDNGSYLQVYHRGEDYLDKPPLLFWLSSASFRLLGISNFTYKLPALLALLLGLWSTYRFTLLYDKKETALMAVTILASTQAFFLMSNDVRTDGLLTGFVMFAVYQCAAYLRQPKWRYLVLAGVSVGFAMLAKGPIGAIIPAIALGADRLFKGRWRDLINIRWIVVILTAIIVLIPMCYGLYTQFDLHPEKIVYGLQGPSGLEFFFWTQSFGRITGEIYWDNNTPWYFFCLTFLWDFMPWALIFVAAFVYAVKGILKREKTNHDYLAPPRSVAEAMKRKRLKPAMTARGRNASAVNKEHKEHEGDQAPEGDILRERKVYPEYLTISGFAFVMILFSFSKYKLPHYIFPLFPFAAILTSRYLATRINKSSRLLTFAQLILMHAFFGAMVFTFLKAFPPKNYVLPVILCTGYLIMWVAFIYPRQSTYRIFLTGCITAITFNMFLTLHLYPNLMQFQAGTHAGRMIREDRLHSERLYFCYPDPSYSLDFYSGQYIPNLSQDDLRQVPSRSWIYTTEENFSEIMLISKGAEYRIIKEFDDYHVSTLKLKFFLKESRAGQLKKRFLIEKI